MGKARYSDDFKRDAVQQITEGGYSTAEVSRPLGVSCHSLYAWVKRYSKPAGKSWDEDQTTEIRRLKLELDRYFIEESENDFVMAGK